MKTLITSAAVIIVTGLASAQPAALTSAPTLKIVASVDKEKGRIVFVETITKAVPQFREEVVIVDGQQVKRKVTVYVPVMESYQTVISAANSRVITTDGKQLPIDEVWKRVAKGTVIVVSGDGAVPAQPYLRALNSETLVLIPAMAVPPEKK